MRIGIRASLVRFLVGVLALLTGFGVIAPADAQYGSSVRRPRTQHVEPDNPPPSAMVFSEAERRIIGEYFRDHPEPPKAESKALPPGIAKKLARGDALPPGIAKRYLPGDLERRLQSRGGFERIIVGEDVLLIRFSTKIILDILEGVTRGGQP